MIYQYIFIFAFFILVYSLFAVQIDKTTINGPTLALLFGVICGPLVLDLLQFHVNVESYRILAELALALVLFNGASNINIAVLKENESISSRLLLLGLPLTIIAGFAVGYLIFSDFTWIELGILATMLAPTDAALGKAVVTNPTVPSKVRESLNVESGLNDGISVPVLFLLIALFNVQSNENLSIGFGLGLFAKEIGIGLVIGLLLTFVADKFINISINRGWISSSWKTIIIIALAIGIFSLAQILGGSGFIACFSGGLFYGVINRKYRRELEQATEGAGDTLSLVTWIIFGSVIIVNYFDEFTWHVVVYALLSLTIVRIVPVLICLYRRQVSLKEKLFIGWFGPRGLASIVFAIIVIGIDFPHKEKIILTVILTVFLSIILHGITAKPFIRALSRSEPKPQNQN